ncbi:zinc finger cchc-type superfamily [Holotrichia oblita]|uniref:Zinc finger cchc-type superfamily n=1 Tax=Holotrichia oblita TaxID=644536 RepID=A0ACB9TRI4_HOLOL|nr:zinc finger cchc-type superfamily [Holotrichia oblita]
MLIRKRMLILQVKPCLLCRPKNVQDSEKAKTDLKNKLLSPVNLEIGIKGIKTVKDGGILIKCTNKTEVDKLKTEAQNKLHKNYVIKTYPKKNPRVKIVGFEDEYTEESLLRCINKQNSQLNLSLAQITVKLIKKMKTTFMAILECDPSTFQRFMKQEKVNIGWSICRVFEHIRVLRCFRCGGFNHIAANCKSTVTCISCASTDHTTEDCKCSTRKCANCLDVKGVIDLDLDVNHSIYDLNCPET